MERDFKGVWIPKEIWLDERLNALDKIILTEIDSLDCGEDGCYASNEYIAKFCQCSEWKVSTAISKLIDLGYIKALSFDGRTRKLKSCLVLFQRPPCENPKAAVGNSQVSNIKSNTKSKSTTRKREGCDFSPGFTEFWNAYPRKVAKQNAAKAWSKTGADDSQSLTATILADVKRRVSGEWKGKEVQYIPHPATYLNQRRWEDESGATETVETFERDLSVEEVMRRNDDCSVPEGFTPIGGW